MALKFLFPAGVSHERREEIGQQSQNEQEQAESQQVQPEMARLVSCARRDSRLLPSYDCYPPETIGSSPS
jgi:hypothetical protein